MALVLLGLVLTIRCNISTLDVLLRRIISSPDNPQLARDFVARLQEGYAYLLLWLVVIQAAIAAAASGTAQCWRAAFRWATLTVIGLLALVFPVAGGWKNFGVSFFTFLAGAVVVALFDATVGDADVDYVPLGRGSKRRNRTVSFLAPPANMAAIYHQVSALAGCRASSSGGVDFARVSRTGGHEPARLGMVTLRAEPVDTRVCVVRVSGRFTEEHLARLDVVRSILGDPTTERDDPTRIHVGGFP